MKLNTLSRGTLEIVGQSENSIVNFAALLMLLRNHSHHFHLMEYHPFFINRDTMENEMADVRDHIDTFYSIDSYTCSLTLEIETNYQKDLGQLIQSIPSSIVSIISNGLNHPGDFIELSREVLNDVLTETYDLYFDLTTLDARKETIINHSFFSVLSPGFKMDTIIPKKKEVLPYTVKSTEDAFLGMVFFDDTELGLKNFFNHGSFYVHTIMYNSNVANLYTEFCQKRKSFAPFVNFLHTRYVSIQKYTLCTNIDDMLYTRYQSRYQEKSMLFIDILRDFIRHEMAIDQAENSLVNKPQLPYLA